MRFTIKRTTHDYVVIRVNGEYDQHSHFNSKSGAKKIIELIEHKKLPTKKYFRVAARRLLTEEEYNKLVGNKKQKYCNQGGRRVIRNQQNQKTIIKLLTSS